MKGEHHKQPLEPKMNYIKSLEQDKTELEFKINTTLDAIQDFRAFLQSSKFKGEDTDGARKDWISTSDVDYMMQGFINSLRNIA